MNPPKQMTAAFAGLRAKRLLRDLKPTEFAEEPSRFVATLNAIHPFRDGNGRCQLAFVALVANQAGHPLVLKAYYALILAGIYGPVAFLLRGRAEALARRAREAAKVPPAMWWKKEREFMDEHGLRNPVGDQVKKMAAFLAPLVAGPLATLIAGFAKGA